MNGTCVIRISDRPFQRIFTNAHIRVLYMSVAFEVTDAEVVCVSW